MALYTVAVKAPALTAGVAAYLGWCRPARRGPRLFTLAVVAIYGLLGMIGWMVDGIAMDTPFRIPLRAVDNGFHLILAGTGLVAVVRGDR